MKVKILYIAIAAGLLFGVTSCNSYLDEVPDNRTEVDTPEKIRKLLVNAYSEYATNLTLFEFMSDNYVDNGKRYSAYSDIIERTYTFEGVEATTQDSPYAIWDGCYNAIAHANHALEAIEKLKNPKVADAHKGEALICRAYWHFYLANVFCMSYSTESAGELGIPYAMEPETTDIVHYERGTLESLYANIDRDIQEALPLIDNNLYDYPAFHFNLNAAYAFAAQFYLFYANRSDGLATEYLQMSIDYATLALGGDTPILRDMAAFDTFSSPYDMRNEWEKSSSPANFLLVPTSSLFGRFHTSGERFGHSMNLVNNATLRSAGPWGNAGLKRWDKVYRTNDRNFFFPKRLEHFIYTNISAGIGYPQTMTTPLTKEKTLLYRAEAYVLMNDLDAAAADLNLWYKNCGMTGASKSANTIIKYYNALPTDARSHNKKPIYPRTELLTTDDQINLLYAVFHARRIETLHEGLRMLDIKRYGMEYYHNVEQDATRIHVKPYDERLAIQLPAMVIAAGMEPNPRNENNVDTGI